MPEVNITTLETMTIMAGSLNQTTGVGTLTVGGSSTQEWASGKHYDVWADDEEQ
ncbi:MAG: hypothetical protein U0I89_03055 [Prevotella sp.]|nr:hypothetical protein [Prevotella sp.]